MNASRIATLRKAYLDAMATEERIAADYETGGVTIRDLQRASNRTMTALASWVAVDPDADPRLAAP